MEPRRLLAGLESMSVLVSVLVLHDLEPRQVEIWQVLAVLASRLLELIDVSRSHCIGLVL